MNDHFDDVLANTSWRQCQTKQEMGSPKIVLISDWIHERDNLTFVMSNRLYSAIKKRSRAYLRKEYLILVPRSLVRVHHDNRVTCYGMTYGASNGEPFRVGRKESTNPANVHYLKQGEWVDTFDSALANDDDVVTVVLNTVTKAMRHGNE